MAAKPTFDLGGKDRPGKADVLTFGIARTADRGRQCLENGRVGKGVGSGLHIEVLVCGNQCPYTTFSKKMPCLGWLIDSAP